MKQLFLGCVAAFCLATLLEPMFSTAWGVTERKFRTSCRASMVRMGQLGFQGSLVTHSAEQHLWVHPVFFESPEGRSLRKSGKNLSIEGRRLFSRVLDVDLSQCGGSLCQYEGLKDRGLFLMTQTASRPVNHEPAFEVQGPFGYQYVPANGTYRSFSPTGLSMRHWSLEREMFATGLSPGAYGNGRLEWVEEVSKMTPQHRKWEASVIRGEKMGRFRVFDGSLTVEAPLVNLRQASSGTLVLQARPGVHVPVQESTQYLMLRDHAHAMPWELSVKARGREALFRSLIKEREAAPYVGHYELGRKIVKKPKEENATGEQARVEDMAIQWGPELEEVEYLLTRHQAHLDYRKFWLAQKSEERNILGVKKNQYTKQQIESEPTFYAYIHCSGGGTKLFSKDYGEGELLWKFRFDEQGKLSEQRNPSTEDVSVRDKSDYVMKVPGPLVIKTRLARIQEVYDQLTPNLQERFDEMLRQARSFHIVEDTLGRN